MPWDETVLRPLLAGIIHICLAVHSKEYFIANRPGANAASSASLPSQIAPCAPAATHHGNLYGSVHGATRHCFWPLSKQRHADA